MAADRCAHCSFLARSRLQTSLALLFFLISLLPRSVHGCRVVGAEVREVQLRVALAASERALTRLTRGLEEADNSQPTRPLRRLSSPLASSLRCSQQPHRHEFRRRKRCFLFVVSSCSRCCSLHFVFTGRAGGIPTALQDQQRRAMCHGAAARAQASAHLRVRRTAGDRFSQAGQSESTSLVD